jgi:hypothetical protein
MKTVAAIAIVGAALACGLGQTDLPAPTIWTVMIASVGIIGLVARQLRRKVRPPG